MKVCPDCAFANDERFPTCVFCKAMLVDVISTPAADPNDPEHARRALTEKRWQITRGKLRFATICYSATITLTAVVAGLVTDPITLLCYFAGSLAVAMAVRLDLAGQLSVSLLQGILSTFLMFRFGPLHPLVFFMLAAHVILAGLFWHWSELLESAGR